MERVMVFIDGSNFYYGLLETLGHARIDFACFCDLLCGQKRRLVHAHYYNVPVRQATDPVRYAQQQKFFHGLRSILHFSLSLGRLVDRERQEECPQCGHQYVVSYRIEKGVDVELAVHMLASAFDDQFDTAILVSQDGDFVPAVAEVRRLRKAVENADFTQRLPSYLSKQCSKTIPLTSDLLDLCILR
ncbi:NYN domain-containing protein [Dehalococcoidia bacterium]|nr:NYN domain-containing protein [Dehalococcoidia bacterium]